MLVHGNVDELEGRWLFQPHVIRPKTFGGSLITVSAMVLVSVAPGLEFQTSECIGAVRCFQLVPTESDELTILVT
jgi:hypothetical protein